LLVENRKRIAVIGLDGATFDIMRPMFAEGRLPNFKQLLQEGASGNLYSTIYPLSSTAWCSFATGRNPAKHGMFDFAKRVEGTYSYIPVSSADRKSKAIWDYASEAGLRSCVVNVPLTYPPQKINGVMISGFPFSSNKRDFAYPVEILEDIKRDLGITSILKPNPQFLSDGDELKVVAEVNDITRKQKEIIKYLMERERWDLFVSVFDGPDVVSHFLWHHIDPNHPKYDPAKAEKYGDLIYDVYEKLDAAFGEIRSHLTERDDVFVISDHGFGPCYYTIHLNNWLMRNGYLKLKSSAGTRFRKILFDLGISSQSLLDAAKKMKLVSTKTNTYSKDSKKVKLAKKLTLSTDDIDWERTVAYSAGNYGPVYLNLKGREPKGKVAKGAEYDNLVGEIATKLKEEPDPRSGLRPFETIYTKDRIYSGPFYEDAPDIVYFDSTWLYYPMRVFEFGNKDLFGINPIYTGAHRMEGIFLGGGPDLERKSYMNMNLIDLTPTLLHMLGLSVPDEMDGKVLSQIFKEGSEIAKRQVSYVQERKPSSDIRGIAQKLAKGKLRI
jgi:predicted AlkP superfamily phosphohydrolase/phosphomutase